MGPTLQILSRRRICPACKLDHPGNISCLKARHDAAKVVLLTALSPVVNSEVNSEVNKRGVYPNTDTRREYMREYMRKRRAV